MTFTAIILLLVSAFMHAGWNFIGKRNSPTAASFLVASLVGIGLLMPFVLVFRDTVLYFTPLAWLFVWTSGFFQAVYYSSLAGAYNTGDMSIAYPLARSSPVIVVTVVSVLLGRGDQVSWQCIYGIVLVVTGGFILPMRRFGELRLSNYLNISCLLALLAAFGTTGYSIVDDEALRLLRQTPNATLSSWQTSIVYLFFEVVMTVFWMSLFIFGRKCGRETFRQVMTTRLSSAVFMGLGIHLTYALVLVSMAFVTNVSYVVAFRQMSIPLGVLLSVFFLHEPAYLPKFVAVILMFAGLILVGTG